MRRGIALILMTGLLALLAAAAASLGRLALSARAGAGSRIDAAQARLLARSGVAYAAARLAQDCTPKVPMTRENQCDDWTCRDGPDVSLEQTRNPSYAQTEPYEDAGADGRYDSSYDPFVDLDGDARFQAWSGRLRGRSGWAGSLFKLRVSAAGGRIDVNAGVLGPDDRNENGIPDARDPGAPGAHADSRPNLRLVRTLNTLGGILGAGEDAGKRIVSARPIGGYRSMEAVRAGLSSGAWEKLASRLALSLPRDPGTYVMDGVGRVYAEPRTPVNLNGASLEVLAALQEGLSCHLATSEYVLESQFYSDSYWENPVTWPDPSPSIRKGPVGKEGQPPGWLYGFRESAVLLQDPTLIWITRAEALNAARFFGSGRPFASRYDLFRRLDGRKAEIFVDAGRYRSQSQVFFGANHLHWEYIDHFYEGVGASVPVSTPQALVLLIQNQCVNLVSENASPARVGGWPAGNVFRAARGPYSWITYDLPRWTWSSGDTRLPRYPGVEAGDTFESVLEPEGDFIVESLGRAAGGRAGAGARAWAAFSSLGFARARSQADFEKEGPSKLRIQSSPLFPLRSCPDLAIDPLTGKPDPRYRFHPFLGDLRLMDRSDPGESSPLLYFPFWEAEQPLRSAAGGSEPARVSFLALDGAGRPVAEPGDSDGYLAAALLTADLQGALQAPGRAGGHRYSWEEGTANPDMPWVSNGTVPRGAVSFWSDGSACAQLNPMDVYMGPRPAQSTVQTPQLEPQHELPKVVDPNATKTSPATLSAYRVPSALAWQQMPAANGSVTPEAAQSVRTFQPGEWHHVAFAFESASEEGEARGYLDGIPALTASYEARAVRPGKQDWLAGCEFPDTLGVTGTAGADEIRLFAGPGAVDGAATIAQALRPRYWETGDYVSSLHVLPGPTRVAGARWDPFVPESIRQGSLAAGVRPLRAFVRLYADPEGKTALRELELSADGSWKEFGAEAVRSFRYAVRMDASAAERIVDTPVFEGIAVGYARRLLLDYRAE